jgi:hypothetical protein
MGSLHSVGLRPAGGLRMPDDRAAAGGHQDVGVVASSAQPPQRGGNSAAGTGPAAPRYGFSLAAPAVTC